MSIYAVVFEKTSTGYSAYVPDLPGCIATGGTFEETERLIHEGVTIHIRSMRKDGYEIPAPATKTGYVETAA